MNEKLINNPNPKTKTVLGISFDNEVAKFLKDSCVNVSKFVNKIVTEKLVDEYNFKK